MVTGHVTIVYMKHLPTNMMFEVNPLFTSRSISPALPIISPVSILSIYSTLSMTLTFKIFPTHGTKSSDS
jgi:hypothetical protein